MRRHSGVAPMRTLVSCIRVAVLACILMSVSMLAVGRALPAAAAATAPRPAGMTLFTRSDDFSALDLGTPGPSDGDERFRHGPVARTPEGPAVGEYFQLGVTIRSDSVDNLEWRMSTKYWTLPGGTLITQGIVRNVVGELPSAGEVNHHRILGGTGIYRGARGEVINTYLSISPWREKTQFLFSR